MGSDLREVFSKNKRLLSPSDYKFVFSRAVKYSNRSFTILVRKNKDLENSRLGLAISKKAIKLAVQRNRIKRLIREIFRKDNHINNINSDFVIMAKPAISQYSNQQLTLSLQSLFSKIYNKAD